jgi:ribosome maturation factor RimP
MLDKQHIADIVADYLAGTDAFLVEMKILPGNSVVVEIDSDTAISIDDCANLSRHIESKLDRDSEDYELEVGSAGLTAPLKLPRQYQKYIDRAVEVLTKDGRKLHGTLKNSDSNGFALEVITRLKPEGAKRKIETAQLLQFSYEDIKYTKYSISYK